MANRVLTCCAVILVPLPLLLLLLLLLLLPLSPPPSPTTTPGSSSKSDGEVLFAGGAITCASKQTNNETKRNKTRAHIFCMLSLQTVQHRAKLNHVDNTVNCSPTVYPHCPHVTCITLFVQCVDTPHLTAHHSTSLHLT